MNREHRLLALGIGALASIVAPGCTSTEQSQALAGSSDEAGVLVESGDFAVIWIRDFREEASTCNPPPDSDWTHFWPVGVYVE